MRRQLHCRRVSGGKSGNELLDTAGEHIVAHVTSGEVHCRRVSDRERGDSELNAHVTVQTNTQRCDSGEDESVMGNAGVSYSPTLPSGE